MSEWEPETLSEFRTLIEHSLDLVSVLDESGTILYHSPSAKHILGEDPDARIGTNAFEYIHPEDREHVTRKFAGMIESPGTVVERVEYRFKHGDGSWMWLESIGTNRTETSVGGYVVNSREITERKQQQQRLQERNTQLEEFANVVSHDIRNPLTIAKGRVDELREDCDSEHIDQIGRALTRIDTIVTDLLMLARDGNEIGQTEPINLAELSMEAWRTVATGDATLHTPIDLTVSGDKTRLAQLFENLFRNGIEHGGSEVTITVGELSEGFYVEDDGPGIPEKERTSVFKPGYSSTQNGTGLGLSIVKQIADGHGWGIEVSESSAGGARFEITGVEFTG